jgi:RsiW-degrading membrane proteinase PrsW (M82 family)
MYNIIGYALLLAIVVTALVWINIKNEIRDKDKKLKVLLRTFLFSVAIMFVFVYFTHSDPSDEAIKNMSKSPPDF